MLRLSLSSSSVAVKSIGFQAARAPCQLPRQQILESQRRWSSKVNIPHPAATSSKVAPKDTKIPVFPGGASKDAPPAPAPAKPDSTSSPPKPATPATPTSTNPTQVPLTPPAPAKVDVTPPTGGAPPKIPAVTTTATTPPPKSTPPPPPPPPPPFPKKKTHKFRNFLIGLTFLSGTAFGGGVFYSLKSDNFHDFFTEYIPFGEEAVLYFEEQEFRRRFPNALSKIIQNKSEQTVTIPKSAGATWRLAQHDATPRSVDVGKPGPHISGKKAVEEEKDREALTSARTVPAEGHAIEAKVVDRQAPPAARDVEKVEASKAATPKGDSAHVRLNLNAPKLSEVALPDAKDPIVQDLVKAVNGIITTVNTSGSPKEYAAAVDAAKSELVRLNEQVQALKSTFEKHAQDQLHKKDLEFTQAAQGLLTNVNNEIVDMEHKWKDEFEAEREKIAQGYRQKLQTELKRAHELSEQRLHNELLEQAIEMKRTWIAEVQDRVETERNGRLGKIHELESAVEDLETLTKEYTQVVDTNIKTQQIFTALEAVRAAYASPDQPRPFLREMAALKEVAQGDELIAAAIDAVNPAAYQNGVATPAQLTDRFRKVTEEVRKAALLPEDAGVAAHAANWVLSKLMLKKRGLVSGNDVESVLTRAEMYLVEGDVYSAVREVNQLAGWSRLLANDWLREARKLLEVEQAIEVVAAEARVQSLRMQKE